jgi:hypothetical protein
MGTETFDNEVLGIAAARRFVDDACGERIAVETEDALSLLPTRADEQARIVDALERATRAETDSTLSAQLQSFVASGQTLLVRPSEPCRQSWLHLATSKPWWGKIRVVNNPRLDVIDATARFSMLYDDPADLTSDAQDTEIAPMFARAERRVCIARKDVSLPERVEHLELDAVS